MHKQPKNSQKPVVDVRTAEEFSSGHVAGSVNIPLQELSRRLEELRLIRQPFILCCASGNRSGVAEQYLRTQGIRCENGGAWQDVEAMQQSL